MYRLLLENIINLHRITVCVLTGGSIDADKLSQIIIEH